MNKSRKRKLWGIVIIATVAMLTGALSLNVNSVDALFGIAHTGSVLSRFLNEIVLPTPAGQYYDSLMWKHGSEISQLFEDYPEHYWKSLEVVQTFVPGMEAMLDGKGDTVRITEDQIIALKAEVKWVISVGSPSLRADIETELQRFPLETFVGMTMNEAWEYVNDNFPPDLVLEPVAMPTEIAVIHISTMPVHQCVVGNDPDCLAGPTLVPGTGGQWASYVLNGVYFEYPSAWRIEQNSGQQTILVECLISNST